MVNPPTRPYTAEELQEVLKLLSAQNNQSTEVPTPSVEPILIRLKRQIVFEKSPLTIKNDVSEQKNLVSETLIDAGPQNVVSVDNVPAQTPTNKSSLNQYVPWIVIGTIVVLVGAYLYWDYREKKKAEKENK
jgi:hypothetical protein